MILIKFHWFVWYILYFIGYLYEYIIIIINSSYLNILTFQRVLQIHTSSMKFRYLGIMLTVVPIKSISPKNPYFKNIFRITQIWFLPSYINLFRSKKRNIRFWCHLVLLYMRGTKCQLRGCLFTYCLSYVNWKYLDA